MLEGTELYDALAQTITEYAKGKGDYDARLENLTKLYEGKEGYTGEDAQAKIEQEVVADLVGDYLFTDKDFVSRLSTENRNVFQKIYDEVKYLCKVATAGSKEARQLEKVKKIFEDAYRAETKNPTGDGGVKYSLSIKYADGTVEELADARSLTDEQAVSYLQQAKTGELRRDTYIPVRKDTPQVIVDTLAGAGENVENLSLVMQVRKAQQAMSSENSGNRSGRHGNNSRKHALTPKEVVEIVNNLDDPSMVILQTNRQGKDGEQLPNNVAVFVEYNKNGKEGVAVIEFESSINPEFIGTEVGDTSYHTVVTVFEPDVERNGVEFDYAEELLSNPNNRELEIVRKQPARSATGEKHPNTSRELLSGNSIRNPDRVVNNQNSLSPEGQTDADSPFPLPWQIKGEDVAFPLPEGYQEQSNVSSGNEDMFPVPEDIAQLEAQKQSGGTVSQMESVAQDGYAQQVNADDSTGAAPSGFDPVSHLQYEYGSLPEGEKAVREDSLPKSTTGKDKVSLTARTVKGAEATPDELVDLLDKETVGGRFSYIPIKNSATVQAAYRDIAEKGWEAAKGEWQAEYDGNLFDF